MRAWKQISTLLTLPFLNIPCLPVYSTTAFIIPTHYISFWFSFSFYQSLLHELIDPSYCFLSFSFDLSEIIYIIDGRCCLVHMIHCSLVFFIFKKRACQKLRHTQTWFFIRLDHFQMGLRPHFVFLVHSWLTVLSQHFPSFYFVLVSPIPSLPLSFWPFVLPPKNASFSLKLENKNQVFKFFLHFIWFASLHD